MPGERLNMINNSPCVLILESQIDNFAALSGNIAIHSDLRILS